jgi:hypothetical protein
MYVYADNGGQWNRIYTETIDGIVFQTWHIEGSNINYPRNGSVKVELCDNTYAIRDTVTFDIEIDGTMYAKLEGLTEGYSYPYKPSFQVRKLGYDDIWLKLDGKVIKIITVDYEKISTYFYECDIGFHNFSLVDMISGTTLDTKTIEITEISPDPFDSPIDDNLIEPPGDDLPVPVNPPDNTNIMEWIGYKIESIIDILTWPLSTLFNGLSYLVDSLTSTINAFTSTYNSFIGLAGMVFGFLPPQWMALGTLGISLSMFLWFVGRK